jgi:hypothetical protein
VCNRTRNKHFACLEQAAKLNFAAVALTTAVKSKSHFNIDLLSQLQHIYLYICGIILQILDWVTVKVRFMSVFVSGTATINTECSSLMSSIDILVSSSSSLRMAPNIPMIKMT